MICPSALIATSLSIPFQPLSAKLTALSHFFLELIEVRSFQSDRRKGSVSHYWESVRCWSHFLLRSRFLLVTDQKALSFMFRQSGRGKIKNTKIQAWRAELGNFEYDIVHRPGRDNVVPDALSRSSPTSSVTLDTAQSALSDLTGMHKQLDYPCVTRLLHFVRTRNLPFSASDVRKVCRCCRVCDELKPSFVKQSEVTPLIKLSTLRRDSQLISKPCERCKSLRTLPLPPEMAKGACYDASRTVSHRDLSWRSFCSTSTSLTCQPPFPESMHMLTT